MSHQHQNGRHSAGRGEYGVGALICGLKELGPVVLRFFSVGLAEGVALGPVVDGVPVSEGSWFASALHATRVAPIAAAVPTQAASVRRRFPAMVILIRGTVAPAGLELKA